MNVEDYALLTACFLRKPLERLAAQQDLFPDDDDEDYSGYDCFDDYADEYL